jgi:hypothetical protein
LAHRVISPPAANSVAFGVKRTYHAVPLSSQQSLPRVTFEIFSIPDVAPQRIHALVPGLIGHLEDRGAASGGTGQEARPQRVASEQLGIEAGASNRA